MRMEDKKREMLDLMRSVSGRPWLSPKELGMAMGRPYYSASAFACPILKALVAEGKVESNRGVYRLC